MLEMNFMHWTYAGARRRGSGRGPRAVVHRRLRRRQALRARRRRGAVAAARRAHGHAGVGRRGDLPGPAVARPEHGRPQDLHGRLAGARGRCRTCTAAAQDHRIPFAPINTMRADVRERAPARTPVLRDVRSAGHRPLTVPGAPSQYSTHAVVAAPPGAPARRAHRRRSPASRGGAAPRSSPRRAGGPAGTARSKGIRVLDFTAGVGRAVLHPEPGPPRRRGDPRRDDGAHAVRHPRHPALRRRRARARPRRLLQPVQPGQAQHPPQPAPARGGGAGATSWSRTATSSPTTSPPA